MGSLKEVLIKRLLSGIPDTNMTNKFLLEEWTDLEQHITAPFGAKV